MSSCWVKGGLALGFSHVSIPVFIFNQYISEDDAQIFLISAPLLCCWIKNYCMRVIWDNHRALLFKSRMSEGECKNQWCTTLSHNWVLNIPNTRLNTVIYYCKVLVLLQYCAKNALLYFFLMLCIQSSRVFTFCGRARLVTCMFRILLKSQAFKLLSGDCDGSTFSFWSELFSAILRTTFSNLNNSVHCITWVLKRLNQAAVQKWFSLNH